MVGLAVGAWNSRHILHSHTKEVRMQDTRFLVGFMYFLPFSATTRGQDTLFLVE